MRFAFFKMEICILSRVIQYHHHRRLIFAYHLLIIATIWMQHPKMQSKIWCKMLAYFSCYNVRKTKTKELHRSRMPAMLLFPKCLIRFRHLTQALVKINKKISIKKGKYAQTFFCNNRKTKRFIHNMIMQISSLPWHHSGIQTSNHVDEPLQQYPCLPR